MRRVGLTLALLLLAVSAQAQTFALPMPTATAIWTSTGANTTEYFIGIDSARWSVGNPAPVAGTYTAAFPAAALLALSQGTHTVTIISKGEGGETVSDPAILTMTAPVVPPPAKPGGIRIVITVDVVPPTK